MDIKKLRKDLNKLELVGVADIAELFDWKMSKVAVYNGRGKLPEPIAEISGRPVWHKPHILDYAAAEGITVNTGKKTLAAATA